MDTEAAAADSGGCVGMDCGESVLHSMQEARGGTQAQASTLICSLMTLALSLR